MSRTSPGSRRPAAELSQGWRLYQPGHSPATVIPDGFGNVTTYGGEPDALSQPPPPPATNFRPNPYMPGARYEQLHR